MPNARSVVKVVKNRQAGGRKQKESQYSFQCKVLLIGTLHLDCSAFLRRNFLDGMCLPAVQEPKPAILAYQLSDLFSLVICGYIGGRCVQLKYPTPQYGFWLYSLAAALVTAFGGGSCYALLMSRPGCRRFGWQDPFALTAALVGLILATQAVTSCEEAFGHCTETFRFFDCVNNAILIAWGCSKWLPWWSEKCRMVLAQWGIVNADNQSELLSHFASTLCVVCRACGSFGTMNWPFVGCRYTVQQRLDSKKIKQHACLIMTASEPPCSEDICLFPSEDVRDVHETYVDGELLTASRIQVGPHSMKLYLAKHVADLLDPDDLGLRLWPGTHAMAYLLLKLGDQSDPDSDCVDPGSFRSFRDRSVLDVGCGTGFVGLLAHLTGARRVVLSDRPGRALELARLNAASTAELGDKVGKAVEVKALSWGKDAVDETQDEVFDMLLLSEVLYVAQPSCVPWTLDDADLLALAEMTKAKLSADGDAWVTYGNREAGGGEQFQRAAEAVGLHFEEIALEGIIPEEVLERSGAALRRVRIFRLEHARGHARAPFPHGFESLK
eukprot:s1989_g9.t1